MSPSTPGDARTNVPNGRPADVSARWTARAGEPRRLVSRRRRRVGHEARRGLKAAEDVVHEQRIEIGRLGVPEARVPRTAAVVAMAPADRVVVVDAVGAVGLGVRRLVHRQQHVDAVGVAGGVVVAAAVDHRVDDPLVVVPLVDARPAGGKCLRRRVIAVLDDDRRGGRAVRVVAEVRAHQLAVPRPAVLGVGRRVDADVAVPAADVALERRLRGVRERVTRRGQEDHDVVAVEERRP